jgi:hypothetical protein
MKIVTASNGKKTVKISKREWESLGKKAGWVRTSYDDSTTWHEEEARMVERQCGNCEKYNCNGKCVLPELKAEYERLSNAMKLYSETSDVDVIRDFYSSIPFYQELDKYKLLGMAEDRLTYLEDEIYRLEIK